jgi:hypothetical protein
MPETPIDMGMVSAPAAPAPTVQQPATPQASAPSAPARVTPGSKAWAEMSAEQRHAQLRGPENPRARGHSPAVEQREAAAARAAGEPPKDPATADPATPAAASTEKLKVGKYEVSEAELAAMMDRQAQDDLRKATLPTTPDEYKLELSPGAKLPGDAEYKFNAADPSLAALKNWAHAKGFDQSTLSEMLTIYATHEAQQNAALAARSRDEVAKAGVNAPQRVDAVSKWITGEMGEADAAPIKATLVTDAHLRFYEKLMNKISSQGTASFSQSHRAAPDTNPIPGYENMSFEQKRHAQEQYAARRGGYGR